MEPFNMMCISKYNEYYSTYSLCARINSIYGTHISDKIQIALGERPTFTSTSLQCYGGVPLL